MPTTISYLITCSTETDTLKRLLEVVGTIVKNSNDEVVVMIDTNSKDNKNTEVLLTEFALQMQYEIIEKKTCKIIMHGLDKDYSNHKNFGIDHCSNNWILQLDGDEMLPENLIGENLHSLIESNPNIEAYAIPRINDFRGVSEEHAKQWGWRLTTSTIYNRPIVNFPDFQFRLFKNTPNIRFKNKLHEKIEGYNEYSFLPAEEEWAIYHDKTIETQIATNLRYNREFSKSENEGHTIK